MFNTERGIRNFRVQCLLTMVAIVFQHIIQNSSLRSEDFSFPHWTPWDWRGWALYISLIWWHMHMFSVSLLWHPSVPYSTAGIAWFSLCPVMGHVEITAFCLDAEWYLRHMMRRSTATDCLCAFGSETGLRWSCPKTLRPSERRSPINSGCSLKNYRKLRMRRKNLWIVACHQTTLLFKLNLEIQVAW